jgi:hypothetical protein
MPIVGIEREISQLIVEEEAVNHPPGAEMLSTVVVTRRHSRPHRGDELVVPVGSIVASAPADCAPRHTAPEAGQRWSRSAALDAMGWVEHPATGTFTKADRRIFVAVRYVSRLASANPGLRVAGPRDASVCWRIPSNSRRPTRSRRQVRPDKIDAVRPAIASRFTGRVCEIGHGHCPAGRARVSAPRLLRQ